MKKTLIVASLALVAFATPSMAANWKGDHKHGRHGKVTSFERAMINLSKFNLKQVRKRAWADGKITPFERAKIRRAQKKLNRVIYKARRS